MLLSYHVATSAFGHPASHLMSSLICSNFGGNLGAVFISLFIFHLSVKMNVSVSGPLAESGRLAVKAISIVFGIHHCYEEDTVVNIK